MPCLKCRVAVFKFSCQYTDCKISLVNYLVDETPNALSYLASNKFKRWKLLHLSFFSFFNLVIIIDLGSAKTLVLLCISFNVIESSSSFYLCEVLVLEHNITKLALGHALADGERLPKYQGRRITRL